MRVTPQYLFLFIGATPNIEWLFGSGVAFDGNGFVLTSGELGGTHSPLETNRPDTFAIGDVRAGSVKRVASAVGEGAQAVAALHGVLANTDSARSVMATTRYA